MKWFTPQFSVDHILKDRVVTNMAIRDLYGYRIVGTDEVFRVFTVEQIESLLQFGKNMRKGSAVLHLLIYRYELPSASFNKRVFRTEGFYVFNDRRFLPVVRDIVQGEPMDGFWLANYLLNMHVLAPLWKEVDFNRKVPLSLRWIEEEWFAPVPSAVYKRMLRNEFGNARPRVFVATVYTGTKPVYVQEIFQSSLDPLCWWNGLLWFTFVLGDASVLIQDKMSQQKAWPKGYAGWSQIYEAYRSGKLSVVPMQLHFFTKDPEADEYVDVLFERLGFQAVERKADGLDVYLGWLKVFDTTSAYFLEPEHVRCYFIKNFAKNSIVPCRIRKQPDLVGVSRSGNLVFYSFWGENPAQHSLVVAPTGSGKTFFLLNMLSELLNVRPKELLEAKVNGKGVSLPFKVRFLDVGLSGEFYIRLMKLRGFDVDVIKPSLSAVRINPFEVDEPDDIDFVVSSVKLILSITKARGEILSVQEEAILRRCLADILNRKEELVETPSLKDLRELDPAMAAKVEQEYNLDDYDRVPYDALAGTPYTQPKVYDVIAAVNAYKDTPGISAVEQEAAQTLISKLNFIASIPNFAGPTVFDIKTTQFLYMDLLYLKGSDIFVPLVGLILRRLIRHDSVFSDDLKLYLIEEAHNLLKHEAFSEIFNVLTREARKHRIFLVYISQNIEDLPNVVLQGIHTKFVLKSGKKDESFVKEVVEKLGLNPEERKLLEDLPRYTPLVCYSKGVFTMSLPVDEAKLQVFDSTRTSLTTDDGITLKKGEM